jgi:hypothetical protein
MNFLIRLVAWLEELSENYSNTLSPTEECVSLLNDIMLTNGVLDFDLAMERIGKLKKDNDIDEMGYIHMIDALHHLSEDGHYRDSLYYKKAAAEEES